MESLMKPNLFFYVVKKRPQEALFMGKKKGFGKISLECIARLAPKKMLTNVG